MRRRRGGGGGGGAGGPREGANTRRHGHERHWPVSFTCACPQLRVYRNRTNYVCTETAHSSLQHTLGTHGALEHRHALGTHGALEYRQTHSSPHNGRSIPLHLCQTETRETCRRADIRCQKTPDRSKNSSLSKPLRPKNSFVI